MRRLLAKRERVKKTGVHEPRWHAALGALAALLLYVTLPPRLIVGPVWVLPLVIGVTLLPLLVLSPRRHEEAPLQRAISIAHIAVLNLFNVATVGLLVHSLIAPHRRIELNGSELIVAAVEIWLTNILVYALWYWEIDGGGPERRAHTERAQRALNADYLFPQYMLPVETAAQLDWRPRFVDYVYLAFNTATAFSPTDTAAMTPLAKWLMMAESLTSLVTVAVIAGRAINILS